MSAVTIQVIENDNQITVDEFPTSLTLPADVLNAIQILDVGNTLTPINTINTITPVDEPAVNLSVTTIENVVQTNITTNSVSVTQADVIVEVVAEGVQNILETHNYTVEVLAGGFGGDGITISNINTLAARYDMDFVNTITNSRFKQALEGWQFSGDSGLRLNRDELEVPENCPYQYVARFGTQYAKYVGRRLPIIKGETLYAEVMCATSSGTAPDLSLKINYYDNDNTLLGTQTIATRSASVSWARIKGEATPSASPTYDAVTQAELVLEIATANNTYASAKRWYFTNARMLSGASAEGANARITVEAVTRADADTVLAGLITTISTEVDGALATITEFAESVDGIMAQWGVQVNVGGVITGLIKLSADEDYSVVKIQADKFIISNEAGTEGDSPFEITGGITYIKEAVIPTLTVDKLLVANFGSNLIINPDAEDNLGGWRINARATSTSLVFSRDTGSSNSGDASFKIADNSTHGTMVGARAIPVKAGEILAWSLWVRGSGASTNGLYIRVHELTSKPTTPFIGSTANSLTGIDNATSTTDLITASSAIPNTWTYYSGTYTVPVGVKYVSFSVGNWTASTVDLNFDDVRFRRQLQGVIIEDGTITGTKIAANTITAANIAAGTITATEIAADSITVDQLTISNFGSNLIINPDAEANTAGWKAVARATTTSLILTRDTSDQINGEASFKIADNSTHGTMYGSRAVGVKAGWVLAWSVWIKGASASAAGLYIRVHESSTAVPTKFVGSTANSLTGVDAATSTTDLVTANSAIPNTWTYYSGTYTVPAGIRFVSFSVGNWAASTTDLYFDDVRFRRQIDTVSIENGSIVGSHIAVGTITAAKIAAGTITATEIAADSITVDQLNIANFGSNLISNPDAETNASAWRAIHRATTTSLVMTRDLTQQNNGAASFKIADNSTHGTMYGARAIPVKPGWILAWNVWVKGSTSSTNGLFIRMYELTSKPTTNFIGSTANSLANVDDNTSITNLITADSAIPNVWTYYSGTYTVPAGVAYITFAVGNWTASTADLYFDDVRVRRQIDTLTFEDGSVTGGKIASATITATQIANSTITATQIANSTITATQIANSTITGGKIANTTITASNIQGGTITGTEIASATIANSNIVNSTITGGKIAANTITAANITAGTITATEIAANTITSAQIAAGTITATEIAADSITVDKLVVANFGSNLILNPDAEENLAGWRIVARATTTSLAFTRDTTTVNGGSASFRLTDNSTHGSFAGSRAFAVKAGQILAWSAWINGSSASAAGLHIRMYELTSAPSTRFVGSTSNSLANVDASTSTTDLITASSAIPNTWTYYEGTYTVPAGVKYVTFAIGNWTASTADLYFDDVRVRRQIDAVTIEDGVITNAKLVNATITGAKIAGTTIAASNIVNSTITGGKIAGTTITASNIVNATITTTQIASATILDANITASTITGSKIAGTTITASNIQNSTITATQISNSTITGGKIANTTITASNIVGGTITGVEIANATITGANIAANTITAANIVAGTITASEIAADSITVDKLTMVNFGSNLIRNSDAEVDTSDWRVVHRATTTSLVLTRDVTQAKTGEASFKIADNSTHGSVFGSRAVPVSEGEILAWSVWIKGSAADADGLYINVYELNAKPSTKYIGNTANSLTGIDNATSTTNLANNTAIPNTWTYYSGNYTVPAGIKYVTFGVGLWTGGVADLYFDDARLRRLISTITIDDGAIVDAKIASTTITGSKISNSTITGGKIANTTITASNIVGGTITNAEIASATILDANITASTITGSKIANSTITGGKIAGTTITASNIVGGTITNAEIASATILDANITASTITGSKIAGTTITASNIQNSTITATQIANSTITGGKIAGTTITASNIVGGTITGTEIANTTISNANIVNSTITGGKIAANTITAANITAGTITATEIAANTITSAQIAAGTITATEIAADSITVDKLVVANFGSNLILNPDAEENLSAWRIVARATTTSLAFTRDTTTVNGGTASFKLADNSTHGSFAGSRAFAVKAGQILAWSVWINGSGASAAGLYIRMYELTSAPSTRFVGSTSNSLTSVDASTSTTELITADSAIPNTWTYYEGTYTVPAGVKYATFAIGNWTASTVDLYFDDVRVRRQIDAVTIEDGVITNAKLVNATITGAKIANTTIAASNIVNSTITATQIANSTITATQIANSTITGGKIAGTTITASNIVNGTITATQISDATITNAKIVDATITGAKIAANTITASNIAAGTITASEIAADSITVDQLNIVNFGSNLIANPDAEIDVARWRIIARATTTSLVFTRDTTQQNSGEASFKIADNSTHGSVLGARAIAVKPGWILSWSVWIKGSSASAAGLYIRMYELTSAPTTKFVGSTLNSLTGVDNNTSVTELITGDSAISNSWTYYSGTYTVPASVKYISFGIGNWTASTADLYFDDVRVRRQLDTITFEDGAVTGGKIASATITASNITNSTITATQIANSTITGGKIAGTTITASNITAATITATEIANSTITATQISNSTITGGKIAGTTITASNITNATITTTQIAASTITGGNIAGTTITASNIVAATITASEIANSTITGGKIAGTTITASNIANSTITTTQIANSTITGGNIAGTTISASNIVSSTITATQIANSTITGGKIANATITGANIAGATITDSNIVGGTITGASIAAGTITASNIAAGTITATEIAADSITVDQLTIANFGSNLISNPDAEENLARWKAVARATTTSLVLSRDTTQQLSGIASFKIADNSTHGTMYGARAIAVKPGWILSWSVWIKGSASSTNGLYIRMHEITSAPSTKFVGSTLNSLTGIDAATSTTDLVTADSAIPNTWTYYSGTYTVPAGVIYVTFSVGNWTASTADLYFDDVRVRRQLDTIVFEDGSVTGLKIAGTTITASNIANSTITATQILNSTITGGKIANTTITASNIVAATITASEIANSTITGGKIAGTTITASNIAAATITASEIANSTITGGKIAGTTITASNIFGGTITATEIANSTITGGKIAGTTITASNIVNATITTTQIANSTITGGNIAGTTISASNIVSSTITATQIANSTITGGKIANATITGANIAGGTITDSNILGGTITGASIAANTITASNIAAGTITASEIAADSITVDQLTIADYGSNLIRNPDAEANIAGWRAVARATTTSLVLSRDTTQQNTGTASFKIADNSTHGTMYGARAFSVKAGWILAWSVWVKGSAASTNGLYIRMHELTSKPATNFVGSTLNSLTNIDNATSTMDLVTADSAISNSWTYYSGSYTVPAGVQYVTFSVGNWTASTADLYFDDVRVRRLLDTITFEDGAVTGGKIASATITASNITNSTITATQIANSTITGGKIAGTTITASNILGATITTAEIAASTITGSNIANSTITGGKIAGTTITASNIFGGTITATEIANSTITGGKIAGTTITASNIVNATITTTQIANSTITGGNIAGTTITASNIANTTITASQIANSTITATQITNSTITGGKIANATITGANIAGGTITDSNILGGTITGASIAAGTITASNISAGTITASEIAADSITVDQLNFVNFGSNLIANSDAETNIAGWRAVARGTTTTLVLTRDITQSNNGEASFKIADNGANGTMYGARAIAVKPGWVLAWSVWIKGSAASTNGLYIRMHELTSAPATRFVGSTLNSLSNIDNATSTTDLVTANSAIPNTWSYYSGNYTVPAGVLYVTFSVGNWTASTADLYFDDARVRRQLDTLTFEDGSITGGKIANVTITASNITAATITASEIANSTITATQILNSTITGGKIAGTTITASNITNATITTTQIANSTITGGNIAGTTITASNIANTTITASQIANSTITATQITNSTITGGKIAGTTITASNILGATITTAEIAASTITGSNIANSTITGGKIAGTTITASNIQGSTITASEIANSTITGGKIANATITGANIAGGTITDSNILGGTITGASIAAGTITASNIAAGTITASEIAADSITVDQLTIADYGANLIRNPDAEANIAGWRAVQRATTTSLVLTRDTTQQNNGAASFKIADNSTHGTMYGARSFGVKAGWILAWSIWVKGSAASTNGLYIRMQELTSKPSTNFIGDTTNSLTGVDLRTSFTDLITANSAVPSSWTYYSGTYTVPASVQYITFSIGNWTASTTDLYFDDVRVRRQLDTITFENGAVTGGKIASATITASNITAATITATEIANSTITATQIANSTITGGKIAGTTITASNITNATITTTQIASSTITGSNIAGTTITASNIANTTITASQIANSTITATQISNSTITGGKIAGTTITASNIVAGTITGTEIASATIAASNIINSTITGGKIASATITGSNIAGGTITDSNILGGTITGASIAAGTITASNISAGTITASEIAADSITVDQLNFVNFGSNLIANSDAETNIAGWRAVQRATTTSLVLSRDTSQQNNGAASFKIADNSTHGTMYGARAIAVKPGWVLAWSVWIKGSSASAAGLYIRMQELTSAPTTRFVGSTGNSLTNVDNATSTTDLVTASSAIPSSWTYYSGNYTVPAGVLYITFSVGNWTASTADLYFDDVRVRRQLDTLTFEDGAITGGKIANVTITAANITSGTITATEIANSTITGGKIAGTTITASNIQNATITTTQIANSTITGGNIAGTTITASNIANTTITASQIANSTITATQITNSTITGGKIAGTTITASNITAATITATEIANSTITATQIANSTITGGKIAGTTITASNIVGGTITTTQIASATITGSNIAGTTITASNIVNSTITATQIANSTITGGKIAAATITDSNIVGGTITGASIAANTITAANIAAGTITASEIAADSITVDQLTLADYGSNLIRNPDAEANIAGWRAVARATTTSLVLTRDTTQQNSGEASFKIADNSTHGTVYGARAIAVKAGWILSWSVWVKGSSASTNGLYIRMYELTSAPTTKFVGSTLNSLPNVDNATSTTDLTTANGAVPSSWTYYSGTYTVPASVKYITFGVGIWTASTADLYFDDVRVRRQLDTITFEDGAVTGGKIASATITASNITGGTITATEIANSTITATQIANSTITGGKIAGTTITASNITNATITTTQIANSTITGGNIAGTTITASNIVSSTITATQISNSTITGGKIANTTITGANIVNATITATQIQANTITATEIAAATITATEIAASTITGAKIAATTIAAGNIVSGTITTTQIAATTIVAGNIASSTITATQIAASTITGAKIAANTITASNIAAGTITATEIAAGTITAANISAGSITANEIAVDSITVDKLTFVNFSSNLIRNPDAEVDLADWTETHRSGSALVLSRDTTNQNSGAASFKITDNGANGSFYGARAFAVKAGEKLAWSIWIDGSSASANGLYIRMIEKNAKPTARYLGQSALTDVDNAYTSTTDLITGNSAIPSSWTYYSGTYTVPAGIKYVTFSVANWTASTADLYFDDVRVRRVLDTITIDDDAITNAKILASTITGAKIAGTTIAASNIVSATITTTQIANSTITGSNIAGTTITASNIANSTITGGKIANTTITASNIVGGTITNAEIASATILDANITASTITGSKIANTTIAAGNIVNSTITATQIANSTITGGKIANTTITASNIVGGTITGTELANTTITNSHIVNSTITGGKIAANTITAANITAGTITATEIAAGTIVAANIAAGTITATQILNSTITGGKIAAGTITATQIQSATITATQIAATTITAGNIVSGTITGTQIAATTIAAGNIVAGTITTTQIAATTIVAGNIAASTITATQIAATTITAAKIVANTITASQIAASTITATEIAATTITAAKIAANTITASQIAAGTITATQIAAGTITAANIAAGSITATELAVGAITASRIVAIGGNNYILDPEFSDVPDYWILGSGWATDTSTEVTVDPSAGMGAVRGLKTPVGNGTTSQAATTSSIGASSNWFPVDGGAYFRVVVEYFLKSGFTGRAGAQVIWYKADKSTQVSTTTIFDPSFNDYRTTAYAGASTANAFLVIIQAPSTAVYGRFSLRIDWSSTQNNAQYIIYTKPSFRPMLDEALIRSDSIAASNIINSTITGAKISGSTITASNIVGGTITATEIANTTITGGKIANNTITATQIANNAVWPSLLLSSDHANLIADPSFTDNVYWTFATNWAQDSSTDTTTTLNLDFALKSPTGNGTTSQTTSDTRVSAANYPRVEPSASYRVNFRVFVKSGFTGLARAVITWYKQDKTTGATVNSTIFAITDYRTTARVGDTTETYDSIVTVSADAAFGRLRFETVWSTTLNNAQYVVFADPCWRRAITSELIVDGTIVAADIANSTITGGKIAATTITAANITALTITANEIANGTITSAEIANSTIVAADIANTTITGGKLVNNTITATQIQAATITTTEIAATTIVAGNIANATITATQIAAATITATELVNSTVTGAKIANTTVAAGNIVSSTITATQIANTTITGAKMVNNTVTATQINAATITTTEIASLTIVAGNIANTTITGGKLANATITTTQIAASTIAGSNIAATTIAAGNIVSGTITTTQIAASTITGSNIAATTIAAGNIVSSTITATQIANTTITGAKMVNNTVTATQIAAATITATEIANSTITGGKIANNTITAANIAAGTITGTEISSSASLTVGSVTVDGGTSGDAIISGSNIEIGNGRSVDGYAYLDLKGDTTYSDYGLRLIRGNTGANANSELIHRGTGELRLYTSEASVIKLYTAGVSRITVGAAGGVTIDSLTLTSGLTGSNIAATTITASNIVNSTITGTQIAATTIAAGNIVSSTITATQIANTTITGGKLVNNTITATQIQAATITTTEIAATTIVAGNIANSTITGGKIANTTITAANITAGTITTTEIASTTIVAGNIANSTITGGKIASTTITAANITASTITATEIANTTITGGKIANATITATQIANSTITGGKIAGTTITAANITASTITATEIANTTITGGKIAATTITGSNLVNGTITATQIAALAITASKHVIKDFNNYIADPLYSDSTYWTFGSGWSLDTSTDCTTTLNIPSGAKTPSGNGTTSQTTTETNQAATDSYVWIEPGKPLRVAARAFVKSGFTGLIRIIISWLKQDKSTSASTASDTFTIGSDYRTVAAGADTTASLDTRITAPSDAVWARYRCQVVWSTTLNNAQYAIFAAPRFERGVTDELSGDSYLLTATAANANTTVSVPAGFAVYGNIFVDNTTAAAVTGGVKIGTTNGGTQVVVAQAVAANDLIHITDANIVKRIFSKSASQTLFIQAVTAWNGCTVNFSIPIRKVF